MSLVLDDELQELLANLSKQTRMNKSALVRFILLKYLPKEFSLDQDINKPTSAFYHSPF